MAFCLFVVFCLPSSSLSSDYYDDYCCMCVCVSMFALFNFPLLQHNVFIRSKFYVLFEKFMNRITINLSTSTPRKSTWSAFQATATTAPANTMNIDFNLKWRKENEMNFTQMNALMEFNLIQNGLNQSWSAVVWSLKKKMMMKILLGNFDHGSWYFS